MRLQVKEFGSQAGGSTVIGLVLGVCTGILMLMKWPELAEYIEPHVEQVLTVDLDSVALSIAERAETLKNELPEKIDDSVLEQFQLKRGPQAADDFPLPKSESSPTLNKSEAAQNQVEPAAVEIWDAFSTESSARKFAHAASRDLNIEVDVVERSPNRFVPTVMCKQGKDCRGILSTINAMFSFEQTDI